MLGLVHLVRPLRRSLACAALPFLCVFAFGTETKVGESDAGDDVFNNTTDPGSNVWDSDGATFYWDFSKADNYDSPGSAETNFDVWNISSLAKNGGNLTISFQDQQSGFGTGNLTGDYEDQMKYSTLTPGYWFNDIVTISGGNTLSAGEVVLANEPGSGTWSAWVEDGGTTVSLRYDGSFPAGYSAVPEPSTYVMVSGLLAMPLWRFFLRFRKEKKEV